MTPADSSVAPPHRVPWWPVAVAAALLAAGVAVRVGCLGADGLTRAETAWAWCYSDVLALGHARDLAAAPLPYVDVMTEYPPLTALQWLVAGWLSTGPTGFFGVTAALQVAAWLGCVRLVAGEAAELGLAGRHLLVVAAAPPLVLVATTNWDALAVLGLTAGLVASRRGRPVLAGAALGLGALVKVFPLVAVAGLAGLRWDRGEGRAAAQLVGTAAATVLAVQVPVAVLAPEGWDAWLVLNGERPVDWDTAWYGLQVLTGRALTVDVANVLVAVAVVGGWTAIAWVALHRGDEGHGIAGRGIDERGLVLALLAWLLVAGKVHSPQFSLWLLPLLALARVDLRLVAAWALADTAVVLTRFPFLAGQQGVEPALGYEPFGLAVAVRAVLLVAVVAAGIRTPRPAPAPPGTPPATGVAARPG
ncbi:glycosyltransferase 87 family protein [Euzebya sp.]|uniref:glycosyltransferase 87 family protein n=1 Tax=Euzebya sp. TaxID=1971409 RepID=UPI003517E565